jgi:aminoglycoside phosphotransferase (APT) family kinase protein
MCRSTLAITYDRPRQIAKLIIQDNGMPPETLIDPVEEIFAAYRIVGPWQRLQATGVANRIYATADLVLRVATDHPDAIVDARTESIAAPVARDAGILTPRLIAFDDSRTIVDRPFSLWERVHGETLGLADLRGTIREGIWLKVGQQIARLHNRVRSCPDPNGYLDTPKRELRLELVLQQFNDCRRGNAAVVREVEHLLSDLGPFVCRSRGVPDCFVHNDLHEWNIMCDAQGGLLAVIDWGDAGWGDPTLDFAAIPLDFVSAALEGYDRTERLGEYAEARIVWDHLHNALEDALENPECTIPVVEYLRFLDRGQMTPR